VRIRDFEVHNESYSSFFFFHQWENSTWCHACQRYYTIGPHFMPNVYICKHIHFLSLLFSSAMKRDRWGKKKPETNGVCIWIHYYSRIIIILFKKKSMKLLLRVKWSFSKSTILIDLRQFTLFYFLIITYYPKKQKLLRGLTVTISFFFFLCFRKIILLLKIKIIRVRLETYVV